MNANLTRGGLVMVNFADLTRPWYPDTWSNILDVLVKIVFR